MSSLDPLQTLGPYETTRMMRATSMVVAAILLTSCSTPEERKQQALMDQIEHEVRLPTGAHLLNAYARYYAFENGAVHAVYIIPWDNTPLTGDVCKTRSHDYNCHILLNPLKAGERRWLPEGRDLPIETEGGCGVVELDFDLDKGRVTNVACHLNA